MENQIEIQQLLELDVQTLETLEQCSQALARASAAADQYAGQAVSAGKSAIMYAIKGGGICLRAKELCEHGDFLPWLQQQSEIIGRGLATLRFWMKCATAQMSKNLDISDPNIKSVSDMYRAVGILPEPEAKQPNGETGETEDKPKLPWSPLKFSTRVEQWTKEQAMDFIYEFDRAAQFVRALKLEFGL
jgi:hypothetical protein